MAITFCEKCGTRLKPGQKFCGKCGAVINHRDMAFITPVTENSVKKPSTINSVKNFARPITAVLSVLIAICLMLLVFVGGIRMTLTEKSIAEFLDDIQISELNIGESRNITVADWLGRELRENKINSLTRKQIEDFADSKCFKEFLVVQFSDLINDFYNGTDRTKVSESEIYDFLWDSQEELADSGVELDYGEIVNISDALAHSDVVKDFSITLIEEADGVGPVWAIASTFVSVPMIVTLILLVLASAAAIFFVNGKSAKRTASAVGKPSVIIGGLFILLFIIVEIVAMAYGEQTGIVYYIISVLKLAFVKCLIMAIILTVIGIVLMTVKFKALKNKSKSV